ncbi:hypothetical protein CDD80_4264 [Ophiocordyceps camponoti-rufipedis]|uniref:Uncharacterized protein n=1 Tax=Ophiocordyceps camponoti-rufipedis TaxID=2004952 RepID=A0A2C5YZ66_9HYPO|nr:hypothetical protein CDD80_4264 [Ophiocordyceps camponoti-rufipedis]
MAIHPSPSIACDPDALPDLDWVPIPKSLTYVAIAGNDTNDVAMASCCRPSSINLVERCVKWCEVPQRVLSQTGGSATEIGHAFGTCLNAGGYRQYILGVHVSAAPPSGAAPWAVVGLFIWLSMAVLLRV